MKLCHSHCRSHPLEPGYNPGVQAPRPHAPSRAEDRTQASCLFPKAWYPEISLPLTQFHLPPWEDEPRPPSPWEGEGVEMGLASTRPGRQEPRSPGSCYPLLCSGRGLEQGAWQLGHLGSFLGPGRRVRSGGSELRGWEPGHLGSVPVPGEGAGPCTCQCLQQALPCVVQGQGFLFLLSSFIPAHWALSLAILVSLALTLAPATPAFI